MQRFKRHLIEIGLIRHGEWKSPVGKYTYHISTSERVKTYTSNCHYRWGNPPIGRAIIIHIGHLKAAINHRQNYKRYKKFTHTARHRSSIAFAAQIRRNNRSRLP